MIPDDTNPCQSRPLPALGACSAIVQLATIIQEEEGLDDNTAYILAEQELDAIAATEAAWSDQQPVAMLRILPTAWGVVLVRNGSRLVVHRTDIPAVLESLTRWAASSY